MVALQTKKKITSLCLMVLLGLVSCHQQNDEREVFYMCITSNVTSLDPAFAKDQSSTWLTSQIFNGLVELDTMLQPSPAIAKSWSVSEDGKIYTFNLRQDVFFQPSTYFEQGTRNVKAQDIKYSFTRICNPKTASPGFWIFNQKIVGLKAYLEGKTTDIQGFEVVNDSTFRVRLEEAYSPFLWMLAMPYAFIVPKEVVENNPKFFEQPIGTGPFILKEWQPSRHIILHKNPNYFEEELPKLSAVMVRILPSKLTAFAEFKQKKLDFINHLDPLFIDEILTPRGELKPEYSEFAYFKKSPQLSTEYLAFQVEDKNSIFHQKAIRQAISHLIDRDALIKVLQKGIGKPAHQGFIPFGMPFFPDSLQGVKYDPVKALSFLQQAGFKAFKELPPFTLYTNPNYHKLAVFIQHSLQKYGLNCKIEVLEPSTLRKEIVEGRVPFWRASWMADYPDPENYLALFYKPNHSPKGPNTTHYDNPKIDSLFQKMLKTQDVQQKQKLIYEIERQALEDCPMIYLFYEETTRLIRKNVKNLHVDAMNALRLKEVYKE